MYEAFGMELQRVNGGHAHTLPLPATYVIDYTTRAARPPPGRRTAPGPMTMSAPPG
ncbi:hypothetical protein [Streptomyces bacillaris]|uniref:hypothetical protein n=1 Tax=Streptomyces bacillaris TaxID=68179 RepID=UPI003F4D5AD0